MTIPCLSNKLLINVWNKIYIVHCYNFTADTHYWLTGTMENPYFIAIRCSLPIGILQIWKMLSQTKFLGSQISNNGNSFILYITFKLICMSYLTRKNFSHLISKSLCIFLWRIVIWLWKFFCVPDQTFVQHFFLLLGMS